jgi:hypothetical protein
MAGSINSPSVIWVAGETSGYNQTGSVVTVSGVLTGDSASEGYVNTAVGAVQAELDAYQARLVASGIIES